MDNGPAFAPLTLKDYVSQMRLIPGGSFRMGSNQGDLDERPIHTVRLSRFRMGATPVTVGMWQEYCRATGRTMPGKPRWGWQPTHPMVNVSWVDIQGQDGDGGYCEWASRESGIKLSLPTESQWEYCGRDGGKDITYPWGEKFDPAKLWCRRLQLAGAEATGPVVRPNRIYVNSLGLSDMAGNVWQLCRDRYGIYSSDAVTDPSGPAVGDRRCLRGGSFSDRFAELSRTTIRQGIDPSRSSEIFGFRLSAGPA